MMKKTVQFVPIIAIAIAGTMFSCVDSGKDLYDPSYETPNPMGDGFAAPDDIDWNMITTKNVSVEVKDEEGCSCIIASLSRGIFGKRGNFVVFVCHMINTVIRPYYIMS